MALYVLDEANLRSYEYKSKNKWKKVKKKNKNNGSRWSPLFINFLSFSFFRLNISFYNFLFLADRRRQKIPKTTAFLSKSSKCVYSVCEIFAGSFVLCTHTEYMERERWMITNGVWMGQHIAWMSDVIQTHTRTHTAYEHTSYTLRLGESTL